MKSIETLKVMESAFGNRTSTRHAAARGVKRTEQGTQHTFVVLDLAVSRRILTSKSFTSFNYFDEGVRRLEASGTPMSCMQRFFDQGLLFQEGPQHHAAKQELIRILDRETTRLEALSSRVATFMAKRSGRIDNPLDLSRLFVRLCIGLVVAHLTSISLLSAIRLLRARENIFYFHFHPRRQQRMNKLLSELDNMIMASGRSPRYDNARILTESLLTMGYDPLVGTLCAYLTDDDAGEIVSAPDRYCATSFVSRVCVERICITGHQFKVGDICYVALVPAVDEEASAGAFPFGLGAHTCIGKRFSISVLRLAEGVFRQSPPAEFKRMPVVCADGAFLSFEHE
ncbi:MAG: hypothetical protein U5R46_00530 [Gammaproteobacteria bacterium]|nr:hypothetical protein [Gammaproteobacteria bacterium]